MWERDKSFSFFLPRAYLKRLITVQNKNFLIIRIILNMEQVALERGELIFSEVVSKRWTDRFCNRRHPG